MAIPPETETGSGGDDVAQPLDASGIEAVQEHCTQLGIHFAASLQTPPLAEPVRAVRTIVSRVVSPGYPARTASPIMDAIDAAFCALAPLIGDAFLGMSPAAWLAMADVEALEAWSARAKVAPAQWWRQLSDELPSLGATDVDLMPPLSRNEVETAIAPRLREGNGFAHTPDWNGRAVETGALARMHGHPLVAAVLHAYGNSAATRLIARLTEMAALVDRSHMLATERLRAFAIDEAGYAIAHTARGVLVHRAVVDETIADYAIVSPTDWNFHPQGAFAVGVGRITAPDAATLLRRAEILVHSVDPCVPCVVEVGHA